MSRAATDTVPNAPQTGFFGHPRGLGTLFFTEMWERVSYYGMRAILLYYMYASVSDGGLGIAQGTASSLMSIYGSAVFMAGVVGGWLADRLLGSRRSIFGGGVLIMCGHICLAVPSGGRGALYLSMVCIVLGTGLLKPNISNVVGDLYPRSDSRRDAGFSIFYMSTNIGAFIAPIVVGSLAANYNYHVGFSFAAFGMALALVAYVAFGRWLGDAGRAAHNPVRTEERRPLVLRFGIGILVAFLVLGGMAVAGVLTVKWVIDLITLLSIVLPVGYFLVMLRSPRTNADERSRVRAYIPLFVGSVFFWMIEEQGSVVLATFAQKRTDLTLGGFSIPPSWFQSVNPAAIVILAPLFAVLWTKLGDRQPRTPVKFGAGMVLAGMSYLLMTGPGLINGTSVPASPLWLVGSFVVVILGELCLSPVGLSATTKLAPVAFASQTMGLWFLSDAAAQGISAQIVPVFSPSTEVAYFAVVGGIVVALGVVMFLLAPAITRRMGDVN
ncbi:peptide MFS transporter [Actinocatenispora rupis]|uniref:Peptide ABC transporter permease n=1 Tax=Actinocatenispora rupis TaxID=519421 RepID=A0A8J3NFB9_9ACTN|nr:peptide MFS transporter [Actinocatenispora rupis]GID15097.1 peptide ABC transporter permease [Actinocatenispora rupis]